MHQFTPSLHQSKQQSGHSSIHRISNPCFKHPSLCTHAELSNLFCRPMSRLYSSSVSARCFLDQRKLRSPIHPRRRGSRINWLASRYSWISYISFTTEAVSWNMVNPGSHSMRIYMYIDVCVYLYTWDRIGRLQRLFGEGFDTHSGTVASTKANAPT